MEPEAQPIHEAVVDRASSISEERQHIEEAKPQIIEEQGLMPYGEARLNLMRKYSRLPWRLLKK